MQTITRDFPSNSCMNWQQVHGDVLARTCHFLSGQAIFCCALVCKRWNDIIAQKRVLEPWLGSGLRSVEKIQTILSTRYFSPNVGQSFGFSAHLRKMYLDYERLGSILKIYSQITHFSLTISSPEDRALVLPPLPSLPKLSQLSISLDDCHLGPSFFGNILNLENLSLTFGDNHSTNWLSDLPNLSLLTSLRCRGRFHFGENSFCNLPELQELYLTGNPHLLPSSGLSQLKNLAEFNAIVRYDPMKDIIEALPDCIQTMRLILETEIQPVIRAQALTNLTLLRLNGLNLANNNFSFQESLLIQTTIRDLSFEDHFIPLSFTDLRIWQHLTALSLSRCTFPTVAAVNNLLSRCHQLRKIELYYLSPHVNLDTIETILITAQQIKELVLYTTFPIISRAWTPLILNRLDELTFVNLTTFTDTLLEQVIDNNQVALLEKLLFGVSKTNYLTILPFHRAYQYALNQAKPQMANLFIKYHCVPK